MISKTAFLSLILFASPAAFSQQIPDRATLDSLLGTNQILNDFETYQIAAGTQEDIGTSMLVEGTIANGQGPNLVGPMVDYSDLTGSSLVWQGSGHGNIPSQTLSVNGGELWISHGPAVNAVGFDMMSLQNQGFIGQVAFFTCTPGQGGTVNIDINTGGPEKVFVGWQADSGICTIEIYSTVPSGGRPVIEDYGYGTIPFFQRYCLSTNNSSGAPGLMNATGSTSIADNDLTLRAESVPNAYGTFVFSSAAEQTPFGNGWRCVSNPVTHAWPPNRAMGGVLERPIDLNLYGIQPGTYYFQSWFRDRFIGPAQFNTTDGISIAFVP